jgi:class 3 adenylate cyclase/tetratricopeptide (TPR) repeat protein
MVSCPACKQENPDGARFCNACGTLLATEVRAPREERKVVTVLFADLVGFTARAERLDPEDVRALLAPYHERLRAELERFGGTVEKFIGDAVMALFGAPVAHEDDPERAVRAALAIRDWIAEEGEDLQIRVGVTTGEALVAINARAGEGEPVAAGDVVNTAARIQSGAPVNAVLVGEQTYRATIQVIEYRKTEPVTAKGKSEPLVVWEALQPRAAVGVDAVQRRLAPLVGRQRELELVTSALVRVREERSPQLVTLVGVPGIGKSRLVYELSQQVERELITWRQGRSLPYGDGVTFWALGEIVKSEAGILESDSIEQVEAKLRRALTQLVCDEAERKWLRAHLAPLVAIGGEDLSERAGEPFGAWCRFLETIAEVRPLVLVFEDLHWADDALLDFVDELVDRVTDVPLFVLGTARPELLERRPGWGGGKPNALTLSLPPLSDDASAQLVAKLLGRPVLEAERQQTLLAKIGGNPLYAEQYVRALVERSDLAELPETVQGIIAARLDALSPEQKRLLQDAAVVGEVFWLGALGAIGGAARWDVENALHKLERKQFVQRARRPSVAGETEYAFRHVLLRDVAYGQIPRAARGEKHRRAAAWIESLGRPEDHAELLADHYVHALEYARASGGSDLELAERAGAAFRDAGDRAAALAAYATAVRFYEAGLELSPSDPMVLLRLGRARFSTESAGAAELEAALDAFRRRDDPEGAAEAALELRQIAWYEGDRNRAERWLNEALEFVRERPDSAVKAKALVDRGRMHHVAGEYSKAIRRGREALPLVERLGLDTLQVQVLYSIGVSRVQLGDADGIADIERGLAIAQAINSLEQLHASSNNLSDAQFFLGNVAEAARTYESLMESVERFGRDADRRWARASMASIRTSDGHWDEAVALADQFIAEVEVGSPHYLEAPCRAARASIRFARGDLAGASADAQAAVDAGRAAKDPQVLVPPLEIRAVILAAEGRRAEAEALLDELIALGAGVVAGVSGFGWGIVDLAWLARDLDRQDKLVAVLESAPSIPWVVAARAIASGDAGRAADVLAETACRPAEAYTRLRAAEKLVAAGRHEDAANHLDCALEFYSAVGAVLFIQRGEALGTLLPRGASAQRKGRLSKA